MNIEIAAMIVISLIVALALAKRVGLKLDKEGVNLSADKNADLNQTKTLTIAALLLFSLVSWRVAIADNAIPTGLCSAVDASLNVAIPCIGYNGNNYWAKLNRYLNPTDANGVYWSLGDYDVAEANSACGVMDQTLKLNIPCVDVNGAKFSASLNRYSNPASQGIFWQLGSAQPSENTPEIVLLAPSNTDTLTLAWLPITMNIPASQVSYAIHVSTTNNFTPNASTLHHTVIGKTQTSLTGLNIATTYYIIVIADNRQGEVIAGTKYASATTFNAPVVLNSTVPVATSDALGLGMHTQNGDTLVFDKTAGTKAPAANSVLISHDSDGYLLRRVDNVTVSGSQINVATSQASLSDILDQATVSSQMQLFDVGSASVSAPATAKMIQARHVAQPDGNRYSQISWDNQLLTAKQTDYAYQDNQLSIVPKNIPGQHAIALKKSASAASEEVILDAAVSFTPRLETDLRWSAFGGIESGKLIARGTLSFDANAIYDFKAASSYNPDPVTLSTKTYTSLYFAGEVPVYQQVTLTVKAKITASANSKIKASTHANATATVSVGTAYNQDTGWTNVLDETDDTSLTAQININGGVQAEVRLIPEIEVKFYTVASGILSVEPYLNGDIQAKEITSDPVLQANFPRTLQPTKFDVNLGVEANISADMTILYRNISVLAKTKVNVKEQALLFSLPKLNLQADTSSIKTGEVRNITLLVNNGIKDDFDPNSVQWLAIPENSNTQPPSITSQKCTPNQTGYECHASLTAAASTYHVFASGFGVLGQQGRQYANVDITTDCSNNNPIVGDWVAHDGSTFTIAADGSYTTNNNALILSSYTLLNPSSGNASVWRIEYSNYSFSGCGMTTQARQKVYFLPEGVRREDGNWREEGPNIILGTFDGIKVIIVYAAGCRMLIDDLHYYGFISATPQSAPDLCYKYHSDKFDPDSVIFYPVGSRDPTVPLNPTR